jgi:aspartate/methionine/tyrosine aminotransferase
MLDAARKLAGPSARGNVPPFIVMDVVAAAARMEERGARVIHMEVGQPAAPAPASAIAAARAALGGPIAYTESLGMPTLRRRIARHYRDTQGVDIAPERIIVTTGSSAAFIFAYLALFDADDRVALAVPGYPPSRHILSALGCESVLIETEAADRHALTPRKLMAAHRKTPLKGLVVASPANPTGTMMPGQVLGELIAAAEDAGIRVISDEIYHGLDYAFRAETAAKFSHDAVVVNSFSKYFCMTGWRVGWMVAPLDLVRSIDRLQQNLAISVPTLSQIAAEAAFDGIAEMEAVKKEYETNRQILTERLPAAGLDRFLPVDGAFYLYADVSRFTQDSAEFAARMLEHTGVAATPGVDFDPVEGRKFLRFCYAGSAADMGEAAERIGAWLKR